MRVPLAVALMILSFDAFGATLQERIDAAAPGSTLTVGPGRYRGDIVIGKAIRLAGHGRPLLVGSGDGTVVQIKADGVIIEGFDVDGQSGGDLANDPSGIHVAAKNVTVRDCRIVRSLFGIYLREADGAIVEGCSITGIRSKEPGEKGSGIHVWNTNHFRLTNNVIEGARDGFYIQASSHGTVTGNIARDLRYGLHYMFSDDNTFEDNTFSDSAAGAALMFSRRMTFRRNRFIRNRGFASVGLLLKTCDDTVAEENLIADNARGLFVEGSSRNIFRRNIIASSDIAVVLYASTAKNRFEDNSFIGNLTPLMFVGRRTDTVFEGNYYSDNDEPDLDGDGRSERPYRLSSVFDHLRGNLTAADLMSQSLAADALAAAERVFPVLEAVPVVDARPRVRPLQLRIAPESHQSKRKAGVPGLILSLAAIAGGSGLIAARRRPS